MADDLTRRIIAAAIEVHRQLGPGLLESAYESCMAHELTCSGLSFLRQVPVPLEYKGLRLASVIGWTSSSRARLSSS